jgi:uncharacterized protein
LLFAGGFVSICIVKTFFTLLAGFGVVLYYLSYLVFPLIVWLCYLIIKKRKKFILSVLVILLVLFVYCRFVEPSIVVVRNEKILFNGDVSRPVNVLVLADLHLGRLKGKDFLQQVVDRVNELHPDLILFAGDFIDEPNRADLPMLFADFARLKAPIYAVTGNHDVEHPGTISADEVRSAVTKYGVKIIDNQMVEISFNGNLLKLYGLSDLFEDKINYSEVDQISRADNVIILAHNPDTAYYLNNFSADLMVSGHTHGGQIRLPWIYQYVIPTEFPFDSGMYFINGMPVLVTAGLGEVVLPMRFLCAPEMIMLNLEI